MRRASATWLILNGNMSVIHLGMFMKTLSFFASSISFIVCHLHHCLPHAAHLIARQSVFMSCNKVTKCHLISSETAISVAIILTVALRTAPCDSAFAHGSGHCKIPLQILLGWLAKWMGEKKAEFITWMGTNQLHRIGEVAIC